MPIHLRAEPGAYAELVLLPGDPRRAEHVAATYLDDARLVNAERGLLGFTGSWQGVPVSVQSTGMGCPSAAIVVEELIGLGARSLLRIGTCGALSPALALGDLVAAMSATPADGTARSLTGGEPHAPTADFDLLHGLVHAAKHGGPPLVVGPVVSSDLFYDPDAGRAARWAARGILAVEMEAAVVFTLGALRGVRAGCLLTVSDLVRPEGSVRIGDAELRDGVDRMTRLALEGLTARARKAAA